MIELEIFTDPMMGLSYESEPFLRYLETHYQGQIQFRYRMAGLVRDIADFMLPEELALEEEEGIRRYNERLARIYQAEEDISGLPIKMRDFALFTAQERSSLPLNKAYKAVELLAPDVAEQFLYRLRFAIIVETRPMTQRQELLRLVEEMGLNLSDFIAFYDNGRAETAMLEDFARWSSLRARGLPAYVLRYGDKELLSQGLARVDDFVAAIRQISKGAIQETAPKANQENLESFFKRHPLLSYQEVQAAFDLADEQAVQNVIQPLLEQKKLVIKTVEGGWFVERMEVD
ncbi:DsbA family protein [Streptococcus thoraltensis]|uniref:DsbA family protein n=1 Tax=Streptococcus thoraltensis TaxID=55085 RepID=UPI001F5ABDDD|nr:DsbA family protein [Streptococcus thoraltensis]